jgi:predicted DNA-binding transcriptional regulator AlpA
LDKETADKINTAEKIRALQAGKAKRGRDRRARAEGGRAPNGAEVSAAAARTGLKSALLTKHEVVALTVLAFPTIWKWMTRGQFPRGRSAFGKTMWLRSEIDVWIAGLPLSKLKDNRPEEKNSPDA